MAENNHILPDNEIVEAEAISNTYILTEDEVAQVESIANEMRNLQTEAGAVIRSIARARKLNGNWTFDQNNYTFTKQG